VQIVDLTAKVRELEFQLSIENSFTKCIDTCNNVLKRELKLARVQQNANQLLQYVDIFNVFVGVYV
jgi:hypothetical protein